MGCYRQRGRGGIRADGFDRFHDVILALPLHTWRLAGGAVVNSALQKFGEQQHIILRHRAIAGDFTFGPLGLGASRDLWAAGIPCKSVEIVCAASCPGYGKGNSSR